MKQFIYLMFSLLLCSCGTMRHTQMQVAERIRKDTVYLSNIQYDSIYINRSSDVDRTRDTITITKTMTEYRYKYLRDTVLIVQRDSIPYEVRITEVKEVKYIPPWIRYLAWAGGLSVLLLIIRLTSKKNDYGNSVTTLLSKLSRNLPNEAHRPECLNVS